MDNRYYAVILAGGRGERFWPLSTRQNPKQTLSLIGGKSLLRLAVERLDGLIAPDRILVITAESLVERLQADVPMLPHDNVIGEPVGRDTAPACALATAIVRKRDPAGVVAILTADHVMHDLPLFRSTLQAGLEKAASDDVIVTIGIEPRFPSTGFGYIAFGDRAGSEDAVPCYSVSRFVEKPDLETAERYVADGHHLWNAGMFMWSTTTLLNALNVHHPALYSMCKRLQTTIDTASFSQSLAAEYEQIDRISIDYAIMEKIDNSVVIRGCFPWFDVGAWPALADHFPADHDGNVLIGTVQEIESHDNIVVSDGHLTALLGVEGLVVVQAPGVTLVCKREDAQRVKELVTQIYESGQFDALL